MSKLQPIPSYSDPVQWAEETFGNCRLGDIRRTTRVVEYAARQAANPGGSTYAVCQGDYAASNGAYRLLRNPSIDPKALEEAPFELTAKRCQQYPGDVLAIQDTTTLSYSHSVTGQLGDLGGGRGFVVHSALAVCPDTKNILGLLDQTRWVRPEMRSGKRARKRRAYAEKESYKWEAASRRIRERVGTTDNIITVCDREGDIYEYLDYLNREGQRFVVRATYDRRLATAAGNLWDYMSEQPIIGHHEVEIQQRGPQRATLGRPARPGRSAERRRVEVRVGHVELLKPDSTARATGVYVVYVRDPVLVKGRWRMEWMLLTSEPVTTMQQAEVVIGHYRLRWLIEDYHKVWKTGCRIEQRRSPDADNLERLAVITAQVAVRVLALRYLAMQGPERPCTEALSTDEWQCLYASVHRRAPFPESPPSLTWAMREIAKLGGWQDTKRNGAIGWITLWRGWRYFQERVTGWRLARLS